MKSQLQKVIGQSSKAVKHCFYITPRLTVLRTNSLTILHRDRITVMLHNELTDIKQVESIVLVNSLKKGRPGWRRRRLPKKSTGSVWADINHGSSSTIVIRLLRDWHLSRRQLRAENGSKYYGCLAASPTALSSSKDD